MGLTIRLRFLLSRSLSRYLCEQLDHQRANTDLVLNMLVDPLMHILRNATDHGIENQTARQEAGKSEEGHISLSFKQKGHSIVVVCKDDGKGIDYQKVRQRLLSDELIDDGQNIPDKALLPYLLKPGFSTKDEVTSTSGRGVGMDVVAQTVSEFGGYLEMNSKSGEGCEFIITLPITMVSQHVLIVRIDD